MATSETHEAAQIKGERVVLRRATEADVDAVVDLLSTPGVVEWWPGEERHHVLAKVRGDDDAVPYVIEHQGHTVGFIQYSEESEPDYRHASIDIALEPGHQDRGLGPDALRALVDYLVDTLGHHRVTIDPAAHNVRAIRAYEKVGFRPVGVMRQYERGGDGVWHDGLLMDLLRDDRDDRDGRDDRDDRDDRDELGELGELGESAAPGLQP